MHAQGGETQPRNKEPSESEADRRNPKIKIRNQSRNKGEKG